MKQGIKAKAAFINTFVLKTIPNLFHANKCSSLVNKVVFALQLDKGRGGGGGDSVLTWYTHCL